MKAISIQLHFALLSLHLKSSRYRNSVIHDAHEPSVSLKVMAAGCMFSRLPNNGDKFECSA